MSNPRKKAERLLRRTISKKEWWRYKSKGYILCTGSKGGLFKLTASTEYGVYQLRPKKIKMCAVPADTYELDPADMITAQYLALKNNEKEFVKTANITTWAEHQRPGERNNYQMTATEVMHQHQRPGVGSNYQMIATEVMHHDSRRRYFINKLTTYLGETSNRGEAVEKVEKIDHIMRHLDEYERSSDKFITDMRIEQHRDNMHRDNIHSESIIEVILTDNTGERHNIRLMNRMRPMTDVQLEDLK